MKKQYRLKQSWLIKLIMKKGQVINGPFFICKYVPSKVENSQFCIVVSNKISKKAVERNLIKRRLREAIRLNMGVLKEPYSIVLFVKSRAKLASYWDFEKAIRYVFHAISKK